MGKNLFKYDVQFIAVSSPKLKDLLNTKIHPVQAINRSGACIIPFKKDNKDFLYIGMTMRKFRGRIKEHEADVRLNRPHTVLARLAQIQHIKVDFNKSKIIFRTSNYEEAMIRESLEIVSNKDILCNNTLSYDIHRVWKEFLHGRSRLILLKFKYLFLSP